MPTDPMHPTSPDFHFQFMDRFAMSALVAGKLPISLANLGSLIDRVYARYPLVEKHMVVNVIKEAFEVIRERLIVGETVHLDGIVESIRLYFNRAKGNSVKARIAARSPGEIQRAT